MPFSWDDIQLVFADANSYAGGIKQRPQHLAEGLAKHAGLLYIEEPGNWLTVGVSPEKPRSNWSAWKAGPREEAPGLWVWTPPPGMPVGYWSPAINRRNHARYAAALARVAGPVPTGALTMVAMNPLAVDWIPHLQPRRVVYDCHDEFSSFLVPSQRPEVILAMERGLMAQAQVTVFSSASLMRLKTSPRAAPTKGARKGGVVVSPQGLPRKAVLLRNACHPEHFAQAEPDLIPAPPDLAPLVAKGPVMLFYGAVMAVFHSELLAALAKRRPDWQFVILGPLLAKHPALEGVPNIHLLGKKPYNDLPAYVAHARVGLLPLKINPQSDLSDRVKLYEYLAGGLGCVVSPIQEAAFFRAFVKRAQTVEEWEQAIEGFLAAPPDARAARRRFASQHSWKIRVDWYRRVLAGPEKSERDAAMAAQWAEEEALLARYQGGDNGDGDVLLDYATSPSGPKPATPEV
ncbi:MAG TPA: glycosyltransferase, partial [bacterium]|nr:glycosyltransferase [bacterium]